MSKDRSFADPTEPDQSAQSDRPLNLKRSFSWSFLGNLVYGVCQLGMLMAIAKMGTPEMVGQFTLGIAIITPVAFLFNMNLRALQATDTPQQYSFGDYLGLRIITNLLAGVVTAIIILIGGYRPETAWVIGLLASCKTVEYISDAFYGFWQQQERLDQVARSIMLRSILGLVLLSLSLRFTHSLIWATLGLLAAAVCILLGHDLFVSYALVKRQLTGLERSNSGFQPIFNALKPKFAYLTLWQLTRLSLPIGISWLLLSLSTNIPRYAIERFLGERELGLFAAMLYLPTAGVTVVFALGQASLTRLAKHHRRGEWMAFQKLIQKLVSSVIALGLSGLVLVTIFGKTILTLAYKPEYAEQSSLFSLLMVWATIYYVGWCLDYAATAARCFNPVLLVSGIKLALVMIVSLWLIPAYGVLGAVIVILLDGLTQLIGMTAVIRRTIAQLKRNTATQTIPL